MYYVKLLILLLLSALSTATAAATLTFCLPTESEIVLDSRKPLARGTQLFYLLLLTKPFISTDQKEEGILEKWSFDPSENSLTAKVSSTAKWNNGSPLTSAEAAVSIARSLAYRNLGRTIRVKGVEASFSHKDILNASGVKILSDDTFKLIFHSSTKNTWGVLREALSSSSRHNRMWPTRAQQDGSDERIVDLISKFPVSNITKNMVRVHPFGHTVDLVAGECPDGDFYAYSTPKSSKPSQFTSVATQGEQMLYGFADPKVFGTRETRLELFRWLRSIAQDLIHQHVSPVKSFFAKGEAGYSGMDWGQSSKPFKGKSLTILAGSGWIPEFPVRRELDHRLHEVSVLIKWSHSSSKQVPNLTLTGSRIKAGRQVWLQDILNDDYFSAHFQEAFPETTKALRKIARLAASTIPVDAETLQAFEKAAFSEASMAPIARYRVALFSRTSAPVELVFTSTDELTFQRRK